MKKILLFALVGLATFCNAQTRKEIELRHWQFSRDMTSWETVSIPHDWAIAGPFDKKWDLQTVAIEQNGEKEKTEKSGRAGALPWIGEGEYKTTFNTTDIQQTKGGRKYLLWFDGAMSEPVVYVNGQKAGEWKYGYNAFRLDITSFVKPGENEILVHLNNREESSRWYPGAGLYRPVKLVVTGNSYIDTWQTTFRTKSLDHGTYVAMISTKIAGGKARDKVTFLLKDNNGKSVVDITTKTDGDGIAKISVPVINAKLWTPQSPNLYNLDICLYLDGKMVDKTSQRVGFRTVSIDSIHGFQLNGVRTELKGVCLHHDLGPLGAAIDKAALIRQIRIMKDMGANAIRTSHNMPSTMQMDVCDSMGMMVMAESFDTWHEPKVKNGYGQFYDEWWNKDITNLIQNNRNHPAIIMWSIGNEIPEQWEKEGVQRAKAMTMLCHELDPTRPVTCGVDNPEGALSSGFFDAVDVPGFNYRIHLYDKVYPKLHQGFILGSETASTVSSRGVYKFPVIISNKSTYEDGQCSSYDTEYCSWSNLPDGDFAIQNDRPWTIGQFVWTGFDYLGEPTPYDTYWPSRSSYFGICDLAGLPKDRYYLYRSIWNTEKPTLHILPHWTWPGREGQITPVFVYTSYPSAELFINGVTQGKKRRDTTKKEGMSLDRFRLCWNDVKYEPGEIKVIAYGEKGEAVDSQTIRTAGEPVSLRLEAEPMNTTDDIVYIDVTAIDKDGNVCPNADNELNFTVTGAGSFKAACNGDATSLEPFTKPQMRLFHGKLVIVINHYSQNGEIKISANDGMISGCTIIK